MESKQKLRKRMKAVRNAVPEEDRRRFNRQIAENLTYETWYPSVKHILVYAAIQSEVNLSEFCERALKDGKILYYPKVCGKKMEFFRVDDPKILIPGAFGVREPDTDAYALVPFRDEADSVMLVPGLAFAGNGYRLGYGGGFYDRYLAKHPNLYTVGIAFSVQMQEAWEPEKYDIPMHEIVTEQIENQSNRGKTSWK